jgi:hypothetical protein
MRRTEGNRGAEATGTAAPITQTVRGSTGKGASGSLDLVHMQEVLIESHALFIYELNSRTVF